MRIKNVDVFEKHGVLTRAELESRYEIMLENYIKVINIEAQTMIEMSKRDIIPAVINYATDLAASINAINATGVKADVSVQSELLTTISSAVADFTKKLAAFEASLATASSMHGDSFEHAYFFRYDLFVKMGELRAAGDFLETITSSAYWPFPTYGNLLFKV